MALIKKV